MMLVLGAGNVWGESVTMSYSGTTTTNMSTTDNNAATLGLTATEWSVTADKGSSSNAPGLNKEGTIRLYYNASGSNTITVAAQNSTWTISSITVVYKSSNDNGTISVGGNNVAASSSTTADSKVTKVYAINSNSFVIGNGNTSNVQVHIYSVTINYSTGGTPKTDTEVTFPEASYSASYPGTFSAPTATVKNASTHATISGATVSYSSNNTSAATVNSSTGAVTLNGVGTATITATYNGNNTYNGSSGSYTLTVADGRTATTMTFPSASYEAIVGESFTSPTATLKNASTNATITGATISYSSSNTSVATVDANTGEVSIVGVGTTTITASFAGDANYQGCSGTYTLTVSNAGGGSSYTWDLSTDSYASASTETVSWTSDFATMTYDKASGSSTNANNYIPPTRTSTRFYTGGTLTISPKSGYKIKSIEFVATTTGYASTLKNSSWTNGTATVSGSTVTVTPVTGTSNVVATVGGTCGFSGVTVYYELASGNAPDAPTLTASCSFWPKTIEAASMTATIAPTTTGSYVRYTTDGSDPTTTTGTLVTTSQDITITATTTVKAIAYVGNSTSGISTATYTLGQTVNSIAEFKALSSGTEARLYLSPENNARVLHAFSSEIYVRDNTGAMCFYLATSLQNPVPQHDWHVAGWIIGKYQPYNNLPELVATSNTTMDYLAIAAPVTETATEPVVISANDFDNYKADWVKISDLRAEGNGDNINVSDDDANTLKVYNKYNLNTSSYYQDPYDGALMDMTGLAVPYNSTKEIVPIYYNDARPIIYVIDENKEFRSPSVDIHNATVRLVRTLSNANWNTFCIPLYMENFEGIIRRYDRVEGNIMMFEDEYGGIEAGMPYLVKPIQTIENPVYSNVTLCALDAKNIEADNYKFVGIYSPENIYTEEKTQLFLKTDGNLYYPSSESAGRLKGLRAYFVVPEGSSGVKVLIDDDFSTMIEAIPEEIIPDDAEVFTISGQHVGNSLEGLPRGIYIVNGKKLIIK